MIYINRRSSDGIETVDEFEHKDWREASRCLGEYRIADPFASYYRSQRSTKAWREA